MKKLFLPTVILVANIAFAQITLEKTYSSENLQVYTNATETFYYSVGQNLTAINIYNADHTLKKQISLPISSHVSSYDNFILSKNIFNADDLLEIVVVSGNYPNEIIQIYNENGVLVKDFGSGYRFDDEFDFHVYHDNTTNTNKLRLFKNSTSSTEIYNLPSTSLATKEIQSKGKLSAFPIPTDKILTIINPNTDASVAEIYDASGKLVLNKSFQKNENLIPVNVENLPKGNYIYKIGNQSAKFIKN